jgi:hypothetical protein
MSTSKPRETMLTTTEPPRPDRSAVLSSLRSPVVKTPRVPNKWESVSSRKLITVSECSSKEVHKVHRVFDARAYLQKAKR